MEIDMTWRTPSPEQRACFDWVCRLRARGKRRAWRAPLTEFQLTEGILMSYEGGMLWTTQAEHWQRESPEFYGTPMGNRFQAACGLILACVRRGPHGDTGAWWTLDWLPKPARGHAIGLLAEFGYNLWLVQDAPRSARELILSTAQDIPLISRWFEIFIDLALGRGWEARFTRVMPKLGCRPLHPDFAKMRRRDLSLAPGEY